MAGEWAIVAAAGVGAAGAAVPAVLTLLDARAVRREVARDRKAAAAQHQRELAQAVLDRATELTHAHYSIAGSCASALTSALTRAAIDCDDGIAGVAMAWIDANPADQDEVNRWASRFLDAVVATHR